ncbi:type III-B CRISPR module RAMP protein Cmr4 [Candidatus Viridilinea mediisalina]|uniref:Type III-B CRISPR module RAMP protein Cmr4 n=1 Tax=Candidatus Viridilinea mediisalina TaxID=2024553 RepID=A0A2A6RGL5_9CHLR|nr:type III-B CRISPR module RAMP protein Cmr4 [Candidatus Viridilinea mediisalina]PDW02162.1 type III-B CRISPR module RAMP protein Cmr4 [Candidatus Viridilinea mediisalina]
MTTYERHRLLFMTTDPVHIGAGGYRLGRVDNSIVREPGTRLPKIPGTSLHGAARSYAAQVYGTPWAAGQEHKHPDNPNFDLGGNPVCYTFGYLEKTKRNGGTADTTGYSGLVNLFDAHVLLFPVHSLAGPVWVSTASRLHDVGFTVDGLPADWATDSALLTWERKDPLNLGWLMLKVGDQVTISAPDAWNDTPRWQAVRQKIVLVHDALFSQIVNSNLEVRTSVAIDPERGAAEDGALFTYEALPRATFLTTEIVLDDYRGGFGEFSQTEQGEPLPGGAWSSPLDVVNAGLRMIEWLGVGGMGTRGFGRMAIVGEPLMQRFGEEVSNAQP